jgi:hypothetical protein
MRIEDEPDCTEAVGNPFSIALPSGTPGSRNKGSGVVAGAKRRVAGHHHLQDGLRVRATDLEIEPSPSDQQWKLRYKVDGSWLDLVPFPLHVPVSQEFRKLVGLGLFRRLVRFLRQREQGSVTAREDQLTVLIGGHTVILGVTIEPACLSGASGADVVTVRLPSEPLSEGVRAVLREVGKDLIAAVQPLEGIPQK